VKSVKYVKVRGLCLVSLGLMSVLVLGIANASASTLLFVPHKGFPYHLSGLSGKGKLETIGGTSLTSTATHALTIILNSTLFDLHLEFLGVKAFGIAPCTNVTGQTETILVNLLGHLGLADPGNHPAVLLLVPGGFEFTCTNPIGGKKEKVNVQGSVIGLITKPAIGVASEEMTLTFEQSKGKQKHTEFLLPENVLMTNQIEETSLNGGAFEQSAQESEPTTLKALPGQGTFLLVLDTK
jgi:hypothetical protein